MGLPAGVYHGGVHSHAAIPFLAAWGEVRLTGKCVLPGHSSTSGPWTGGNVEPFAYRMFFPVLEEASW
eukprot:scaffold25041_cov19-Tisochrysis_lutea.AAC.1